MSRYKAVLVVSFGTSYVETRKKTIEELERDLSSAFPDRKFYRAWTSKIIIRVLEKRTGEHIDTTSEALDKMLKDGVGDVVIQPTHFVAGIEYDQMMDAVREYENMFDHMYIGKPLLSSEEDKILTAKAIREQFKDVDDAEALVLMGHGTEHSVNDVYDDMNRVFNELGYDNFYLGTVEAKPDIHDVQRWLKEKTPKRVFLTPFMLVAGDHANNDLAGDNEDSWNRILLKQGYEVECIIRGMGEYKEMRNIYIEHAKNAEEI